jgi:uncharacterized protein YkwD
VISRIRFLLPVACVLLLTAVRPASAQQAGSAHSDPDSDYRHHLELQTFELINAYRKAGNLPLFKWDDTIAQAAREHSRDMALGTVDFGHAGFRDRVAKLGAALPGLKGAGENVFESDDPTEVAQTAVAVWLKSPPHLKNIRGDFNYSGLGIWADKEGLIYFTQIFLKLEPAAKATQDPPPGIATPFGLLATPNTR